MQMNTERSVDEVSLTFDDPDAQENVDIKGVLGALTFSGTTALPLRAVSASDMSAMLAAGFTAWTLWDFFFARNYPVKPPPES